MVRVAEGRTARVDTRVLRGQAPVRYVARLRNGTWLVGACGFTDRGPRGFGETSRGALLGLDPTLRDALGLRPGWAAWRTRSRSAWTRTPLPDGEVHFLAYEVRPSAPSTRGKGAFVNAWVRRRSLAAARRVAKAQIARVGYRIVSVADERRITIADCAPAGRKLFRQAEVDGETFTVHEFPIRKRMKTGSR